MPSACLPYFCLSVEYSLSYALSVQDVSDIGVSFVQFPRRVRARPVFQRCIGSPVPSNSQCILIPAYVSFILLSCFRLWAFVFRTLPALTALRVAHLLFSANRQPGCLWFLALGAEGAGFVSNFLVVLANTLAPSNGSCSISQGEHSTYDTVGNFEPTDIDS